MEIQLIPWNTRALWREANDSVAYLIRKYQDELADAVACAREIQHHLAGTFLQMDELGGVTCARCRETCCSVAKLWYDIKDLIFLHLLDVSPAQSQPLSTYRDTCRYLGSEGCILPRMNRPWICIHYICHTQMAYLRRHNRTALAEMENALACIKQLRNEMEDAFIRVTR